MWRMHIACWLPKANNTRTGSVVLVAVLLQQWLHEGASVLCLRALHIWSLKQNNNSIASEIQYQT